MLHPATNEIQWDNSNTWDYIIQCGSLSWRNRLTVDGGCKSFLVRNFIQTGFGQFADLDHAYPPDRQMWHSKHVMCVDVFCWYILYFPFFPLGANKSSIGFPCRHVFKLVGFPKSHHSASRLQSFIFRHHYWWSPKPLVFECIWLVPICPKRLLCSSPRTDLVPNWRLPRPDFRNSPGWSRQRRSGHDANRMWNRFSHRPPWWKRKRGQWCQELCQSLNKKDLDMVKLHVSTNTCEYSSGWEVDIIRWAVDDLWIARIGEWLFSGWWISAKETSWGFPSWLTLDSGSAWWASSSRRGGWACTACCCRRCHFLCCESESAEWRNKNTTDGRTLVRE